MGHSPVLLVGRHWAEPSHPGYQLDLTGESMLRQARVAPGVLRHLALEPLSEATQYIEEPMVGQVPFKPRQISPTYTHRWISTSNKGQMAWIQIPNAEEAEQRRIAREGVRLQLEELCEKADRTPEEAIFFSMQIESLDAEARTEAWAEYFPKLTITQRDAVAGLVLLLSELDAKGTGFLEEVPNLYETGATGIRWNFAVPNVPVELISNWELQADQKQCFRIKRLSPLPQQVRSTFSVYIGGPKTLFALVFTKDEAVELRHFRNLPAKKRADMEAEWERVLATGSLSPAENLQIAEWQSEINLLKKAAASTGSSKFVGPEAQKILDLKDKIEALKESKNGLTDAMKARADRLVEQLFYKREPITLSEDTRSLFDQDFTITLGFHRRGLVSVRLGIGASPGKQAFFYEIEGITKTGRPAQILPAGSHIMIRSNGGPFGIVWGVADHAARATLATQPFEVPFLFDASEWHVDLDAIGLSDEEADPLEPLQKLPRCRIESRVEQVSAGEFNLGPSGTLKTNPKARVVLDFYSDPHPPSGNPKLPDPLAGNHDYGPELYRATAVCLAGDPSDPSEIVWDSRETYPITDVQLQTQEDGASSHDVFLENTPRKPLALPLDAQNRWCEFGMVDTRPGPNRGHYTPLVTGGRLARPLHDNVRRVLSEGKIEPRVRADSSSHVLVQGFEGWLDRPIEVPLVGNGLAPNEYLYALMAIHGAPERLLQGIPRGNLPGLERLPPARIGQPPDIKPNVGDSLLSYLRDEIVAKHCVGWRLRLDGELGIVFERAVWRDRTASHYQTGLGHQDLLSVHEQSSIWQDIEKYFPEAIFEGAYNPGEGKRFRADYRIWEATHKPGSAYYIRERRRHLAAPDDSLKSRHKCILACRAFRQIYGLPPWFTSFSARYDPDRRVNDLIRLDSLRWVVESVSYERLAVGAKQMMRLGLRLFDDVPVADLLPVVVLPG